MEEPLGEFEGQNVVVLEVEEEVFETERRENWAQRVKLFPVGVDDVTVSDGDEVQILASRFGKGSVRYRKQFSVGCLVYQSAESTISHSSPSSTLVGYRRTRIFEFHLLPSIYVYTLTRCQNNVFVEETALTDHTLSQSSSGSPTE